MTLVNSSLVYYITVLYVFVVYSPCMTQDPDPLILRPLRSRGPDSLIIIVPETNVDQEAYRYLGVSIQKALTRKMWIAVVDVKSRDDVTPDNIDMVVRELLYILKEAGCKPRKRFYIGHGYGGTVIQKHAKSSTMSSGIILLASHLLHEYRLTGYPLPVLTLLGDIDGVTKLTGIIPYFKQINEEAKSNAYVIYNSTIIARSGYNHGSYITGTLPERLKRMDIPTHIKQRRTIRETSKCIAAFVVSALNKPLRHVDRARLLLKAAYEESKKLVQPFLNAMMLTQNRLHYTSAWVRNAQVWVSGLNAESSQHIQVESYVVGPGTFITPTIAMNHDKRLVSIITFTEVVQDANSIDTEIPQEIIARMISAEKIRWTLNNTSIQRTVTCKDINYSAFLTAYYSASSAARQRFDDSDRGVIFVDDIEMDNEYDWMKRQLHLEMIGVELHVTSVSWRTPSNHLELERFGLFYCKLLPLEKIMEWIYIDSLKKT